MQSSLTAVFGATAAAAYPVRMLTCGGWCAQKTVDGQSRLKRVTLIGDHHQLPPVVKNMAFQKYSHLDQSLFTRFIRLGVPTVQLNAQASLGTTELS